VSLLQPRGAPREIQAGFIALGELKKPWVKRFILYRSRTIAVVSTVFASANYTMSFDALHSGLGGLDAWILVLDTRGINVWCAAGKGTFGTEELVSRIAKQRLSSIVNHRKIVLPQLGAPGVSAPEVARRTGFRVEWGPVRAEDIRAWLAAGPSPWPPSRSGPCTGCRPDPTGRAGRCPRRSSCSGSYPPAR